MRNQMDNLEEADMNFDQVVSTVVYLDNLADVPAFEKVYGKYFKGKLPAQTTLQQIAPADRSPNEDEQYPDLEQVSLIAVRNGVRRLSDSIPADQRAERQSASAAPHQ
jgi:hypothetical protein